MLTSCFFWCNCNDCPSAIVDEESLLLKSSAVLVRKAIRLFCVCCFLVDLKVCSFHGLEEQCFQQHRMVAELTRSQEVRKVVEVIGPSSTLVGGHFSFDHCPLLILLTYPYARA
jgi:hypothetical protein